VPAISELPVPNLFLASLPAADLEALRPHLEKVQLPLRLILHEMGGYGLYRLNGREQQQAFHRQAPGVLHGPRWPSEPQPTGN
jgi:hypothetical protein